MRPYPCFIGGEPRVTGETIQNINPSDLTDVVGDYCLASLTDTEDAITAARSAFAAWRRTNALQRAECLDRIGGEILSRSTELGDLLAREEGKTLKEATAEVARSGSLFKFITNSMCSVSVPVFSVAMPGTTKAMASLRSPTMW